jgi:hypothetical protein
LLLGLGCGPADEWDRPDPVSIGAGKADLPSFFREINEDLGCGETLDGKFVGSDSAHAYAFELKKGMRYTFELDADYPFYKGAAVAVYDQATGNRVALDRNPLSSDARVSYTPATDGTHVVGVYSVKWKATGDYTVRVVCQLSGIGDLAPGQSSFVSYERKHSYPWFGPAFGLEGAKAAQADPGAPAGRTGEVEEADIYKVDQNRLFYLNTYRGFLIYDLADPKQPKLISRLPVYGYPVEMFVQNNTVYALLRDALYLTQEQGKLKFKRHHVSQLVAIDISNLSKPKVLQTVDIIGHLKEGVSRKIQDTIYVVSHQPRGYFWGWMYDQPQEETEKEQAWVYSFNVADPKNLKLVEQLKIFEGGSYSDYDQSSGTSESRSFSKLTLSATSNTLLVVENWRKYGSVYGSGYQCGSSKTMQQAIVTVIDISDPSGKITKHTTFETYGEIGDQFKQTYVYDETTGKGTYLGLFARREWQFQDCSGSTQIENNLEAWDITDGANPQRVGKLSFGKPNETIRGSVFDADRKVAFAITAEAIDPLYALSFADPAQPKVLSEVDGLSGDMNVFRFIGDRKFLVAVGRDNSATCTGFGDPTTGWSSNVAVSIIDVQDLTKIRLVQRECVSVNDASWVGSQVNWNLDQAHKMIGMHSDGLKNIVSVPVYYSKKVTGQTWGWYRRETAVGLISWDLTQYDPTQDELNQTVLANHGTVVHPEGEVRRSIVFSHQGTTIRRKMVNLSNTHMALVDLEDLASPSTDSTVEIAPYVAGLYSFKSYLVEQIGTTWNSEKPAEFRVKKAGPDLDLAQTVASFTVEGRVRRVIPFKDYLVILRQTQDALGGAWANEAVVFDLSQPEQPAELSSVKLPLSSIPYGIYRCGTPTTWIGRDNPLITTDHGLVILKHEYSQSLKGQSASLVLLDLDTPSAPSVSEETLDQVTDRGYLDLVADSTSGGVFYVNYREKLGEETVDNVTFEKVKYSVQRWSHGYAGWQKKGDTNLPGRLLNAWSSYGFKHLLSHDKTYDQVTDGGWRESSRINLLMGSYSSFMPKAVLLDSEPLTGLRIKDLALDGSTLSITATEVSPASLPPSGPYLTNWMPMPYVAGEDQLLIYSVGMLKLSSLFSETLGTERVELMGVHKGLLFLNLPSDGVLVVDAGNPLDPRGHRFVRTLGYATQVEFFAGTAYVPAGHYGVYEVDLYGPPSLPLE